VTVSEIEVGDEGLAFIQERLEGGHALSLAVLSHIDLADGVVFTWAPTPTPTHILQFDRGDVIDRPASEAEMLGLIRTFFDAVPDGSLWSEDPNARRSDPFWSNPDIPRDRKNAWFFGEEVYDAAFAGSDDQILLTALSNAWAWGGWGGGAFLTASSVGTRYRIEHELLADDLDEMARQVRNVICPEYDADGYLVWRPRSANQ